jgi:ATP-binding cassette subfamily B protein/subfamily B ATP-binding cassette protein MsbA
MLAIPITFFLDSILSKGEAKFNEANRELGSKWDSWLYACVQGWRESKSLNLQKHQMRQFVDFSHKEMVRNSIWINYWTARTLVVPKIKDEFFMQFGLYFLGGLLVVHGKMDIGNLLVFVVYYKMTSNAIQTLSSADAEMQSAMPYTQRMLESLSIPSEANEQGLEILKSIDSIELSNVTFSYDGQENVIQNFNLNIEKGDRVAISGRSGGGKTTLLKLIFGILVPSCGQITYSGIDSLRLTPDSLFARVGIVMQENLLFNTTIRENLYYGKNGASDEELIQACSNANILDFIHSLPDKFETVIGEKGIKLSGGQKQRIVLARLFLRDVDVYAFDEATSALDQQNESIIQDTLQNISNEKIVLVVSHRHSSLDFCNKNVQL